MELVRDPRPGWRQSFWRQNVERQILAVNDLVSGSGVGEAAVAACPGFGRDPTTLVLVGGG